MRTEADNSCRLPEATALRTASFDWLSCSINPAAPTGIAFDTSSRLRLSSEFSALRAPGAASGRGRQPRARHRLPAQRRNRQRSRYRWAPFWSRRKPRHSWQVCSAEGMGPRPFGSGGCGRAKNGSGTWYGSTPMRVGQRPLRQRRSLPGRKTCRPSCGPSMRCSRDDIPPCQMYGLPS